MTVAEFDKLPLLMRESQVALALGITKYWVRKLRAGGTLTVVRTKNGQMKYHKMTVGRLAGLW